jgi:tetratricopeptide (TPR) repeat protein
VKLPAAHKPVQDALKNRPMRIDELAAQTGISYEDLTRTLYALTLIEMVVPADQIPSEKAQPPARPPQRKALAAPPPTEPTISDEVREELMELALNHRRKDPFAILGIDPDHADATAHHRFLRFAEKFAPWQFNEDLAEKARDVFLAGARAYAEVCDPDRRALLVQNKASKSSGAESKASKPTPKAPMAESRIPVRRPEGGDQFRIKTDLLDSDAQFRKGMKLLESGRYEPALEQLDFAAELDPQNLRYSSEAAYCRFLTDPVSNAKPALEKLREAIRVDPQFGLALFYSGEILRKAGKFAEAESFLKRSLKPMAPDRRPVDALRALNRDRKAAEAT